MLDLLAVTVSTRDGRKGTKVAEWFLAQARDHGKFNVIPVDLREVNLPLFNEPRHPRFRQYEHEHTKRWSGIVEPADAFVFVTPEYNFGAPPSLVNALDYLVHEWSYKPAAFVSYGGVSAGTRSVQMAKQIVTGLKMMPMFEAVSIPFFSKLIDEESGRFDPGDVQVKAAAGMLDELLRWAEALKPLRNPRE